MSQGRYPKSHCGTQDRQSGERHEPLLFLCTMGEEGFISTSIRPFNRRRGMFDIHHAKRIQLLSAVHWETDSLLIGKEPQNKAANRVGYLSRRAFPCGGAGATRGTLRQTEPENGKKERQRNNGRKETKQEENAAGLKMFYCQCCIWPPFIWGMPHLRLIQILTLSLTKHCFQMF